MEKRSFVDFTKAAALDKKLAESKYGPKAQKVIEQKMERMKGEDKPAAQKAAIALDEARSKGLKVPEPK